jgi:Icc-related predicted phosphoesterase
LKLLVTADLHYNLKQYDWVLDQAPLYDAIIMAGDLLDLASNVTPEVQSLVIERYLLKMQAQRRILVSSGNHDVDENQTTSWMTHLRQEGLEVDGMAVSLGDKIQISLCPWWQTDEEKQRLYQQLRADQPDQTKEKICWIWVHHAPPDQTPLSWTGKAFKGEPLLNEWVSEFQPDLVFCGHIHYAPFKQGGAWKLQQGKTWIFNAGSELGSVPTHLIVDLTEETVEWRSSAGSEQCILNSPSVER